MSTVFSIPGLWLPRPRKVWRPPLLSAMGHLVTKSNHLVKTTGHHLSKQCAVSALCTGKCSGSTPTTVSVSLSGSDMTVFPCRPAIPPATTTAWDTFTGNLDGTYTPAYLGSSPDCRWSVTVSSSITARKFTMGGGDCTFGGTTIGTFACTVTVVYARNSSGQATIGVTVKAPDGTPLAAYNGTVATSTANPCTDDYSGTAPDSGAIQTISWAVTA
jgi:hypothetical protein